MSKLSVCFLADLPKDVYPFDEYLSKCFIVGYYVGSNNFRVVRRFSDYCLAEKCVEDLKTYGYSNVRVYRQLYNLQLLKNFA